jgi:hypothetical protein
MSDYADPQARAVTEDALLESGRSLSWLGWVRRIEANEKVWATHCPRPSDWGTANV